MRAIDLLSQFEATLKTTQSFLVMGDDPLITDEWKKAFRSRAFVVKDFEIKKTGPDSNLEDEGASLSLFSTATLYWIKIPQAMGSWTTSAKARYKKILSGANAENVFVIQIAQDKRLKKEAYLCDEIVSFEIDITEKKLWMTQMNQVRGNKLDAARLNYLFGLDLDLLAIDQAMELWSLGGDIWAQRSLSWGAPREKGDLAASSSTQPAYDWVDSVLNDNKARALQLLKRLFDEGSDPFQLLSLLSKSVRIVTSLEASGQAKGEADFLVRKLRPTAAHSKGRGHRLLSECAKIDKQMKSSPVDPESCLLRLSSLS